jgi:streptogramin lyase
MPEVGSGILGPMAVAPDGSVWYGAADGVAVLRDGTWTPRVVPKSRRLAVSTDSAVWSVTTAGNVQRYDPRTGAASWVAGCREPSVLEPSPDGTMYVGTLGYMTGRVYVVRDSRCQPLDPLGDGKSYYVGDLAADPNGRLLAVLLTDPNAAHDPPLLGGWISYIALLDAGRWTVLATDLNPGALEGVISGWDQVAFAPDGSIWRARMKEEGGGIERWDGRAWHVVIPDVKVFSSMSFGPDGSLWFEGEFGLFRIRAANLTGQ